MKIKLNKKELERFKESLIVHTDGCFCGHALGEVGSVLGCNLYLVFDFSCRKSSQCGNPYYEITRQGLFVKQFEFDNGNVVDLGSYCEEKQLQNMYSFINDLRLDKKSYMKTQEILKDYYVENWYMGDIPEHVIPYFDL